MSRPAAYVICTAPRSGSTLLCDLLKSTGVAGEPASWFHNSSLDEWARALGVSATIADEADYVAELFANARHLGSGGGDVFGLRLQRDSGDFFFATLRQLHPDSKSDVEAFESSFGPTRFIHLVREDKVEQAVSCVRAIQTGLWHVAADGSELERSAPHREPAYDAVAIREHVETFLESDRHWSAWFSQQRITPMRVSYDLLAREPGSVLRGALANLGLDPTLADDVTPGLQKMADAVSEEWVSRFRAEDN